jgi:hypothetical protein
MENCILETVGAMPIAKYKLRKINEDDLQLRRAAVKIFTY